MQFNRYLQERFPSLKLRPPLFYHWEIGIRFELGVDYDSDKIFENCPYLEAVYRRVVTLFKSLHSPEDEIFIVADVNDFADGATFKRKLNIFSKYVKDKSVLSKLQHTDIPYIFPEDDEDGTYRTHRFTLKCKTTDLHYVSMLKAICNQDMGLKPNIFHDIYFINSKRETIFHVYDDRGCDLVATSPDKIRDMYDKYNDWILDFDRTQIDKVFKKST